MAPPRTGARPVISTASARVAEARNRARPARRSACGGSDCRDAVSAIDRKNRAGYISARRRGEEQQRTVEILGLTEALQRNSGDQRLAGLSLKESAIEVGLDIARSQRIDEDVVPSQF